MKINWKVRFKNPVFWFNLAASVFLPMLACLGFNWEDMTSWQAVGNVFLQAVQSDSSQALTYTEPKKSE